MLKISLFRVPSLYRTSRGVRAPVFGHHMYKTIAVTFAVLAFMALLLVPAKAAQAFETSSPTNTAAAAIMPFSLKLPLPTADGCLPLLHKSTGENAAYAMDQTRRSQGESGAVSVVVGLRFALGSEPKRRTSRNAPPAETMAFGAWTVRDDGVGNSQALAMSEYRRCRAQLQDQR